MNVVDSTKSPSLSRGRGRTTADAGNKQTGENRPVSSPPEAGYMKYGPFWISYEQTKNKRDLIAKGERALEILRMELDLEEGAERLTQLKAEFNAEWS